MDASKLEQVLAERSKAGFRGDSKRWIQIDRADEVLRHVVEFMDVPDDIADE